MLLPPTGAPVGSRDEEAASALPEVETVIAVAGVCAKLPEFLNATGLDAQKNTHDERGAVQTVIRPHCINYTSTC